MKRLTQSQTLLPSSIDRVAAPSGGIRERRRAELIDDIKRIALERFREAGYDGTSLKDVCDEVGISVRTLFRHFKGKDAILGYDIEKREQKILQRLSERPRQESLLVSYSHAIDEMLGEMIANPEDARLTQRLLQEVPSIRGQYLIPSPDHRTDAMDHELAQRTGLAVSDGRLSLLRCFLVTAVFQGMVIWTRDGAAADLRILVGEYLQLLAPVVENIGK